MRRVFMAGCIAACLISCGGGNQGASILSPGKMQQVLWDMLLADAFTEKYLKGDSSKSDVSQNAALQKRIFELNKVSREDFYRSFDYYNSHPDLMHTILDSIGVKADRDRNELMTERYSKTGIQKPAHSFIDSMRRTHDGIEKIKKQMPGN